VSDLVFRNGPPFPFGATDRIRPRQYLLSTGVDSLNLGAYEGQGYLLRMMPFDRALQIDLPGPLPFGSVDRRVPRHTTIQGKTTTIWPAATGNAARSTAPGDTPGDTFVGPYFNGRFNYDISLFSGAEPMSAGRATVGVLQLDDPEGALDDLRTLGWDVAPIAILRGDPDAAFSTWSVVANLTSAGMIYDTRRKEIRLRDLAWNLERAELHGQRYLGTGGEEGDATIAGHLKPYCVGQVKWIPPKLIASAILCYQVSCSSVLAIDAVYDGGLALDEGVDRPDYEELAANAPAPGTYDTCLARGLFRLGSSPVLTVSADVRGDADTINGLSYPHTRAQIARRIATGRGVIRLEDPGQIDGAAYRALEQVQPATLGFFWDGEITKAAALTEVMAGCLGWWFVRLNGRLAVGQLEEPATAAATFSLAYPSDDGTAEVRVGEPVMTDTQPPRRATLMGWGRNYTPLTLDQIAGAMLPSAAVLMADSRFTGSPNPWVGANFPSSPVISVHGGFAFEADAQREGDRQQRLMSTPREAFEIPAVIDPVADVAGRVIAIEQLGRFGFGSSRNLFCSGIRRNGEAWSTLQLFG
jgi:hypothetical protein